MESEINGFLVKVLEIDYDIFYAVYLPENPHVALWSSKNYVNVKFAFQAAKKQVEGLDASDYRG